MIIDVTGEDDPHNDYNEYDNIDDKDDDAYDNGKDDAVDGEEEENCHKAVVTFLIRSVARE